MAAALVQVSPELVVNTGTSGNVVFSGNTTAGNLIVILVSNVASLAIDHTVSGFTVDKTKATGNSGLGVVALRQANTAGGATTFGVSSASAAHSFRAIGYEFSGMATVSALDTSDSNSDDTAGAPTAAPTPGITTTTGGVILVNYVFDRSPGATGPTGWTATTSTAAAGTGYQGYWAYKIFGSSTSSERGAITAITHYDAVIVAYKASGGAAFTPNTRKLLLGVG